MVNISKSLQIESWQSLTVSLKNFVSNVDTNDADEVWKIDNEICAFSYLEE